MAHAEHAKVKPQGTGDGRRALAPPEQEPTFSRELYSFAIIALCAWLGALFVLPPRLERHTRVLELEETLRREVQALHQQEVAFESAILGVENDPFYREEAHRLILGVRKKGEEFLKKPPVDFR